MPLKRNEIISIFRFIASIGIVAYHFAPPDLVKTAQGLCNGPALVTFFFVLSGFMTWGVSSKSVAFSPLDFLCKRLAKLAPFYYLAFILSIIPMLLQGKMLFKSALFELLFIQTYFPPNPPGINGIGWFISCLVFFYIVHALSFRYVKRKNNPIQFLKISILLWCATQIILTALLNNPLFYKGYPSTGHDVIYYFPLSHICSFILGSSLGAIWFDSNILPKLKKNEANLFFLTGGLLCILALHLNWSAWIPFKLPLGASFYAPLFGFLILETINLHDELLKHFNNKFFSYLGTLSFPLFIFQSSNHLIWITFLSLLNLKIKPYADFSLYLLLHTLFSVLIVYISKDRFEKLLYGLLSKSSQLLQDKLSRNPPQLG